MLRFVAPATCKLSKSTIIRLFIMSVSRAYAKVKFDIKCYFSLMLIYAVLMHKLYNTYLWRVLWCYRKVLVQLLLWICNTCAQAMF